MMGAKAYRRWRMYDRAIAVDGSVV
jgi:hypothetical protein